MSAQAFTPGPWVVVTGKNIGVGPCPGKAVAICNYDNGPIERANAALIAAAPELYEALRVMVDKATRQNWNDAYPEQLAQAKAVQP